MKEVKKYLTNNNCYKSNKKMSLIKGVMVHSTATPGATTESFVKAWDVPKPNDREVCVHAFIDDEQIVNTLPYNVRSWGCGGSGNNNYIQIEMCEPKEVYFTSQWEYKSKDIEKTKQFINKQIEGLIEFIVNRLEELGINEINEETVTSHYEGHKKGIASNHDDPRGYLGLAGMNMNKIRELCKERMSSKNKKVTSANGIELITEFEGLKLEAYKDSAGTWTIGYGHTSGVYEGQTITKDKAIEFLKQDIKSAENAVNNLVKVEINQNQFDALVSFTYNLGSGSLSRSTLLEKLNSGDIEGAADEFDRWVFAGGIKLAGLVRRRSTEKALFMKGYQITEDSNKNEENESTEDSKQFLVKVTAGTLNIRSGPGTAYNVVGKIKDQGVYTIVKERGNWGELKSGAGWISLNYTRRV